MLRRMTGGLLAAGVWLAIAGAASAQTTPTARQTELAQRYVTALQMEKTVGATMDALLPAMMGAADDKLPTEARAEFTAIMRDVTREMIASLSTQMAPVLAETFTEKELEDVVAFYEGPSGRAFIEKTPVLSAKMAPIVRELMPQMQAKIVERLCRDGKCAATAKGK